MKSSGTILSGLIIVLLCACLAGLTLVGIAASRGRALTDVATIVGGFGQLFFAGAVFLLSWRQFQFTKSVSERQARIDTYQLRRELYREFDALWNAYDASGSAMGEFAADWFNVSADISRLFSPSLGDQVRRLRHRMFELEPDSEHAREVFAANDTDTAREIIKKERSDLSGELFRIQYEMHNIMRLDPDYRGL